MCIKSILDTDAYKFYVSYAYMKLFPNASGKFTFTDRDDTEYDEEFLEMLKMELVNLGNLRMTNEELDFVKSKIRFVPHFYWEWLKSFNFDYMKIIVYLDNKHLKITVEDTLYKATLYETPILAIVSEVRNK